MSFEAVLVWLEQYPYLYQIVMVLGVLVLSLIAYLITKHYVCKTVTALIQRSKIKYDDMLVQEALLRRLSYLAPLIVIHSLAFQFPFADINSQDYDGTFCVVRCSCSGSISHRVSGKCTRPLRLPKAALLRAMFR